MSQTTNSRIGYFDILKHSFANSGTAKRFYPDRTPIRDSFQQVLSSLQTRFKDSNSPVDRGLKIPDYFKHPVRVSFHPAKNARQNLTPSKLNLPNKSVQDHLPTQHSANAGVSNPDILDTRYNQAGTIINTEKSKVALTTNRTASSRQKIDRAIGLAAEKYGLPPALIRGVIQAESSFRPQAVSPAGAQGLMQLMPATAKEMGVYNPFDIKQNIDGGSKYLKKMVKLFDGDIRKALAAYNAGPGTVQRYKGNVPYSETRKYVERVLKYSGLPA